MVPQLQILPYHQVSQAKPFNALSKLLVYFWLFYIWLYIYLLSGFLYYCTCLSNLVEPQKVATGFREFLKTLKKPAAQDVNDKCKLWVILNYSASKSVCSLCGGDGEGAVGCFFSWWDASGSERKLLLTAATENFNA